MPQECSRGRPVLPGDFALGPPKWVLTLAAKSGTLSLMDLLRRFWFLPLFLSFAACSRAPSVRFDNDTCLIDDVPASIAQVEEAEARISQHMADRQPLFILVTLMVVLLASAGYVLRIVDVIAVRKDGHSFLERLREALDRHRAHPARYFAMLSGAFMLLLFACGFYGALNSDKQASERALSSLQFCHLALRTADEHNVLSQQRQNLAALSATAGQIRSLVGQLPPDEQKKAQLVINQVSQALDRQSQDLARSLDKDAAAADEARAQSAQVEQGLSSLTIGVLALRNVPASLSDVAQREQALSDKLDGTTRAVAALAQKLQDQLAAVNAKLDRDADQKAQLAALAKRLDTLEIRLRPQPASAPVVKAQAKPSSS